MCHFWEKINVDEIVKTSCKSIVISNLQNILSYNDIQYIFINYLNDFFENSNIIFDENLCKILDMSCLTTFNNDILKSYEVKFKNGKSPIVLKINNKCYIYDSQTYVGKVLEDLKNKYYYIYQRFKYEGNCLDVFQDKKLKEITNNNVMDIVIDR